MKWTALALVVCVACSAEPTDYELPSLAELAERDGKTDYFTDDQRGQWCLFFGEPVTCDPCELIGMYGNGTCDRGYVEYGFCRQSDPDCQSCELLEESYNNLPVDSPSDHFGSWGNSELTYAIASTTDDVSNAAQREALRLALETWALEIPVVFREVSVTEEADIQIDFAGTEFPLFGCANPYADARFPTEVTRGRIWFNDNFTWTMNMRGARHGASPNLIATMIHELGHTLGLRHAEGTPEFSFEAMYPHYNEVLELSERDIARITAIYGARQWSSFAHYRAAKLALARDKRSFGSEYVHLYEMGDVSAGQSAHFQMNVRAGETIVVRSWSNQPVGLSLDFDSAAAPITNVATSDGDAGAQQLHYLPFSSGVLYVTVSSRVTRAQFTLQTLSL